MRVSKLLAVFSLVLPVSVGGANASLAQSAFDSIQGKWTPVSGPDIGAPIIFQRAFAGYDAFISWWGQTAISQSGGYKGSHVKVEGQAGDRCYYYVTKINNGRMAWNLRHAGSGNCPGSVVFERGS